MYKISESVNVIKSYLWIWFLCGITKREWLKEVILLGMCIFLMERDIMFLLNTTVGSIFGCSCLYFVFVAHNFHVERIRGCSGVAVEMLQPFLPATSIPLPHCPPSVLWWLSPFRCCRDLFWQGPELSSGAPGGWCSEACSEGPCYNFFWPPRSCRNWVFHPAFNFPPGW